MAKNPTQSKGSAQEQTETTQTLADQNSTDLARTDKQEARFPDPNSPNAVKERESERAKRQLKKETFIVMKPQIIDGVWVKPAAEGEDAVTVQLLEPQARFRLLNGKLARPSKKGS